LEVVAEPWKYRNLSPSGINVVVVVVAVAVELCSLTSDFLQLETETHIPKRSFADLFALVFWDDFPPAPRGNQESISRTGGLNPGV
jgi:hypothetical protein